MSDFLPDDLAQWPGDPYELLGVTNTTAQRQVRKSYARLIRRFRPESHPQHYQRIRAA